jgi:hypothetical protein
MKIDKSKLYEKYMSRINQISDDLEDKSYFYPEEIVDIICDILHTNPELIEREDIEN